MTASRWVAAMAAFFVCMTGCGSKPPATTTTTTTSSSSTVSATTSPSSPSQKSGYAIPGCYSSTDAGVDRPKDVVLQGCMQNGFWLEDLTWTAWGPQGADGSGTLAINTCVPNCASGQGITKKPVVVHAANPRPAPSNSGCPADVKFYADLILGFPNGAPPSEYIPVNTNYNGMPASDVNKPSPPDSPSRWGFRLCS